MKELYDHKLPIAGLNSNLNLFSVDEPGQGNACHHYRIEDENGNCHGKLIFQNGPVQEFGVNGVSNEAVLAVLIDRMRGFQSGPFACRDNAIVLTHLEEAMNWLLKRTIDRVRRGVEGKNQK